MTIKQLHDKLTELGVDESRYYLHGLFGATNDDEKVALSIKVVNGQKEYQIYFRERGETTLIRSFNNEPDACRFILKRLMEHKQIEDRYQR